MTTAAEIRDQMGVEQARLDQEHQRSQDLEVQKREAEERQLLRRRLDAIRQAARKARADNSVRSSMNELIDQDHCGPHLPEEPQMPLEKPSKLQVDEEGALLEHTSCSDDVCRREFTWKLEGMSWLRHALQWTDNTAYAISKSSIEVRSEAFDLVYNPNGSEIDETGYSASLAMRWLATSTGMASFKYRFFIQRNDGEFVQWGPQGEYYDRSTTSQDIVFGPDVQEGYGPTSGVFGLSHEELLKSEWIHNDTFRVKLELELRHANHSEFLPLKRRKLEVETPPSSLSTNLLSLLDSGRFSDVTFLVKGERMEAHSQILAARSEVFERQLQSGMRESVSKEVLIDDCEPSIFRALLQFLYCDDLSHMADCMKKSAKPIDSTGGSANVTASSSSEASSGSSTEESFKNSFLQDMLSVSHKYQVTRLSAWCQQQLSEHVTDTEVCSVLSLAHLCDAKALEEVCLEHIKENMQKVMVTPGFVHLSAQWPELLLKISLFVSGLMSSSSSVIAAQRDLLRKRQPD
mmetsp:Transcript_105673/g.187913  ORF Transcript_105673/g.187913 Transcript_105673/m.187913 type:complete len:519 (+) Transcript_105673:119-1675(+)|eukprot:CAMPEP_0197632082 /NCGR_PEP_ID=MMETSP1338-20131121/9004_1 /TAXON_ID=43686 ORGANISM="Pelagodinium beii, Strain RCC1491" /NCGR_SAMPLE_ID=MMETSP1338 /ASSEMBLY_ACC=CAM_ASM_000754 /LENGTH=518 /DNA_ID=CAMNT_0043203633 /DNA_START=114 /DNA_END=1670 /DNA_ORIENTATION=+